MDERLLNPGEEVLVSAHPHWSFLLRPAAAVIAALAVCVAIVVFDLPLAANWIGAVLLLLALLYALWVWIEWRNIDLVVTNDRLVFSTGVIAKRGIEIPLERINTVFFNQSLIGRLVGSGDLTVESAGEGGQQHFRQVQRPRDLQQEIYKAIELDKQQGFEAMAAAHSAQAAQVPAASIPQQINELDQLRMRGIITDAEFQAKKAELLDRM